MDDLPELLLTFDFDDDPSMTFNPGYTPSPGVSLRAINLTGATDYVTLGMFVFILFRFQCDEHYEHYKSPIVVCCCVLSLCTDNELLCS